MVDSMAFPFFICVPSVDSQYCFTLTLLNFSLYRVAQCPNYGMHHFLMKLMNLVAPSFNYYPSSTFFRLTVRYTGLRAYLCNITGRVRGILVKYFNFCLNFGFFMISSWDDLSLLFLTTILVHQKNVKEKKEESNRILYHSFLNSISLVY